MSYPDRQVRNAVLKDEAHQGVRKIEGVEKADNKILCHLPATTTGFVGRSRVPCSMMTDFLNIPWGLFYPFTLL